MSHTLITNIGLLVTNNPLHDGTPLGLIADAAMVVSDGKIEWVGSRNDAPTKDIPTVIDALGNCVIPGFVDTHNHLVFAGDRAHEFSARMRGEKYQTGGINYTMTQTRAASDQALRANVHYLVHQAMESGTTTLEIKSGYGLTVADERRSLEIASEFTPETTFLGAHIVPPEYVTAPDDYVSLITETMIDEVTRYAKWIDVFCDRGAFTPDQTRRVLQAGKSKGLLPRIHANQLEQGEGIAVGVELDAASVDHVSHFNDRDIALLSTSNTVATFLPGAEFSTRAKYPDVRPMFEAGVNVALGTDCNPGSSYTNSMPFVIALAVREFFFTPEQALWSATAGGAKALRRKDIGSLRVGASADFLILNAPSYIHFAYRPGVQLIEEVWRHGNRVN